MGCGPPKNDEDAKKGGKDGLEPKKEQKNEGENLKNVPEKSEDEAAESGEEDDKEKVEVKKEEKKDETQDEGNKDNSHEKSVERAVEVQLENAKEKMVDVDIIDLGKREAKKDKAEEEKQADVVGVVDSKVEAVRDENKKESKKESKKEEKLEKLEKVEVVVAVAVKKDPRQALSALGYNICFTTEKDDGDKDYAIGQLLIPGGESDEIIAKKNKQEAEVAGKKEQQVTDDRPADAQGENHKESGQTSNVTNLKNLMSTVPSIQY